MFRLLKEALAVPHPRSASSSYKASAPTDEDRRRTREKERLAIEAEERNEVIPGLTQEDKAVELVVARLNEANHDQTLQLEEVTQVSNLVRAIGVSG